MASKATGSEWEALRSRVSGEAVRVPKMAELVADDLRRKIIRGELSEGAVLPPENELMEQFGVSRPTLREAYRVLESENLITVRRGAHGGPCVQTPRREVAARYAGLILEYHGVTLRDVYDARAALEVPSVGQLARRRTDEDLAVLTGALQEYRQVLDDPRQSIQLHGDFHLLVVRLAGNETLLLLSEMLHHIIEVANVSLKPEVGPTAERARRRTAKTHGQLVDLIRDRDVRGAENLWRRHLDEAEGYLLGDDAASTVLDLLG